MLKMRKIITYGCFLTGVFTFRLKTRGCRRDAAGEREGEGSESCGSNSLQEFNLESCWDSNGPGVLGSWDTVVDGIFHGGKVCKSMVWLPKSRHSGVCS